MELWLKYASAVTSADDTSSSVKGKNIEEVKDRLIADAEAILREKSHSIFALPKPLLQSLGLRPWACKLAGRVKQTRGYNFYIQGKTKN